MTLSVTLNTAVIDRGKLLFFFFDTYSVACFSASVLAASRSIPTLSLSVFSDTTLPCVIFAWFECWVMVVLRALLALCTRKIPTKTSDVPTQVHHPGARSMPRDQPKHWAIRGSHRNVADTTTGEKKIRQITYPALPKKPAVRPKSTSPF